MEHIADLIREHPHASDMFAKYLNLSLEPIHLGYYRTSKHDLLRSIAERLLKLHPNSLTRMPEEIAKTLVYSYKDHGFVIDSSEAAEIFGQKIVHTNSDEYALGNEIYQALTFVGKLAEAMKHYFYFIGSSESDPNFRKRARR